MNSPSKNLAIKGVVLPLLIGTLSLSACSSGSYKLAAFDCDKKNSQKEVSSCKAWKQNGGNNIARSDISLTARKTAKEHFNLGIMLLFNDSNAEAEQEFDKAISIKKDYADAHLSKGIALINIGQNQAALKELDKAIKINPRLSQAHYYKGLVHKELHDYKLAIKNLQSAVFINPNYASAHYAVALIFVDYQNNDAALASFKHAYEIWNKKLEYNSMYFLQEPELEKAYYKTKRYLRNVGELKDERVSGIF